MREDKVAIVKKLEETINLTREGIVQLEYEEDYVMKNYAGEVIGMYSEAVVIRRIDNSGSYIIGVANVAADSGVALIRDVMKQECFN
jgi:hypothetical protein